MSTEQSGFLMHADDPRQLYEPRNSRWRKEWNKRKVPNEFVDTVAGCISAIMGQLRHLDDASVPSHQARTLKSVMLDFEQNWQRVMKGEIIEKAVPPTRMLVDHLVRVYEAQDPEVEEQDALAAVLTVKKAMLLVAVMARRELGVDLLRRDQLENFVPLDSAQGSASKLAFLTVEEVTATS